MEFESSSGHWPLCDQQERASRGKRNACFNHSAFDREDTFQECVERPADLELPPQFEVAIASSLHPRAHHKWQEQRNERGHSLDAEASLFHFPAQFAAAVTALMHRVFVNGAPQKPMLRHRNKNAAIRSGRPEHLPQYTIIFVDVFENIECSDDIELALERNLACIHLV